MVHSSGKEAADGTDWFPTVRTKGSTKVVGNGDDHQVFVEASIRGYISAIHMVGFNGSTILLGSIY